MGGWATGGGSIFLQGNGTLAMTSSSIIGGHSSMTMGGCLALKDTSRVTLLNCTLSGCTTASDGAGAAAWGTAVLVLNRTNVHNNVLISRSGYIGEGAGVIAGDSSTVVLEDAVFTNNHASYAGGLSLRETAALRLRGVSIFTNNSAEIMGGGLRLTSDAYDPEDLRARVHATKNAAGKSGADVSLEARNLEIVNRGNLGSFWGSTKSSEALRFTLNVSSAHGLSSDDAFGVRILSPNRTVVFIQDVEPDDGELKEVKLNPSLQPGGFRAAGTCH